MVYRLVLRARFENEAELERVLRGLERLEVQGAKVNVNIGKAGRQGAMGLSQIASAALSAGFMINMLASAYMRMNMAQLMTERGQRRLNKIIEQCGANSEEAREASQDLEMQMNYLNMANMRVNVSTGLMMIMMAKQIGLLNTATIASAGRTLAAHAATIADWAHVAALKVKAALLAAISGGTLVPVMLVAATITTAGLAVATAPAIREAAQINIQTEVTVSKDVDEALERQNRQVKEEVRNIEG